MSKKPPLTKIPDLGDLFSLAKDVVYDDKFWKKIAKSIQKENDDYEKTMKRITPTREDMQKEFDL